MKHLNGPGVPFILAAWLLFAIQSHDHATGESLPSLDKLPAGMEFAAIPGGTFTMGTPADEVGRELDEIQHQVALSPFEMMTTEVTQSIWLEVMGRTIHEQRGDLFPQLELNGVGDDFPVFYVSPEDIQEFVDILNASDPGKGYRLPTEAEWEYACRAGTTTRFHSGDTIEDLGRAGWYLDNADRQPHPVGQKQPNAWGLYDMHGNIFEFCSDWYGPYPSEHVTDPQGPATGSRIAVRGGAWERSPRDCRSGERGSVPPGMRIPYFGFRLVRNSQR